MSSIAGVRTRRRSYCTRALQKFMRWSVREVLRTDNWISRNKPCCKSTDLDEEYSMYFVHETRYYYVCTYIHSFASHIGRGSTECGSSLLRQQIREQESNQSVHFVHLLSWRTFPPAFPQAWRTISH